jgi:NDP-4-keto-2,6-dideoxyhexose 3-C-methyltransferase
MVRHLDGKATEIKKFVNIGAGDIVLDIGSNDGTLLTAMDGVGARLVGMDPTGVKFREYYPENAQLIPDFFSSKRYREVMGRQPAKVITSIAMFYDLEDPLAFVRQVCDVLSDDGIWVLEQSYLPLMLKKTAYDTVCHEHLEYYALKQILWLFERAGLVALDVQLNEINGGSFSITAAKKASAYSINQRAIVRVLHEEQDLGLDGLGPYRCFHERVLRHRDELVCFLDRARSSGEVIFGYGASTKGNVILQFCGITPSCLPFIAEVNPDKFGAFTPGSLIPIISEEQAKSMRPSCFLVFPWHFRDNIVDREESFVQNGGKLIFPLPSIEVVGRENSVSSGV